jgi:regulation of enolase protein 1 (concanavalin A-like superfamily)
VEGDFTLSTRLRFYPANQYDQAGLMVRVSPHCWLKTSVEFEAEGPSKLGVVVTNRGYSDWSTQNYPAGVAELALRVHREGGLPGGGLGRQRSLTRSGHPPGQRRARRGVWFICSPIAAGFRADLLLLSKINHKGHKVKGHEGLNNFVRAKSL